MIKRLFRTSTEFYSVTNITELNGNFIYFQLVRNLKKVIHNSKKPVLICRIFYKLVDYWKRS